MAPPWYLARLSFLDDYPMREQAGFWHWIPFLHSAQLQDFSPCRELCQEIHKLCTVIPWPLTSLTGIGYEPVGFSRPKQSPGTDISTEPIYRIEPVLYLWRELTLITPSLGRPDDHFPWDIFSGPLWVDTLSRSDGWHIPSMFPHQPGKPKREGPERLTVRKGSEI